MTKFNDGDIIEYLHGGTRPSGQFYEVINNGTSITGARDSEYTPDGYPLGYHEDHFHLVEPGPAESEGWKTVQQEEIDLLARLGVEFESRVQVKITGGK